jgi:hypothetical protein
MIDLRERRGDVFAVVVPRGDDGMGMLGEDGFGF